MHLLAPIGKIVLASINYFQDENNKIKAIKKLEEISTVDYDNEIFKNAFDSIMKSIEKEKECSLMFIYATLSKIFSCNNEKELANIFLLEYSVLQNSELKSKNNVSYITWLHGFLAAIYSISCCNIITNNEEIEIPEHIKHAINYIEKHNYIVKLSRK